MAKAMRCTWVPRLFMRVATENPLRNASPGIDEEARAKVQARCVQSLY